VNPLLLSRPPPWAGGSNSSGRPARIVQLAQIPPGFEEGVLAQVQGVLAVAHQLEQVVVDPLFPTRHQKVVGIHIAAARLGDQIPVFHLPEDQVSAPS
jgi:hypothetical protein